MPGRLGEAWTTPGGTLPALFTGPTTIRRKTTTMNIKDIAATLAILGSGALAMTGCGDKKPATEVPGGDEAAPPTDGGAEAKCSAGHTEEGHCGDEAAPAADGAEGEGEASCSAEGKAEGSCSGK